MDFNKINDDLYFKSSHHKFAKKPTDFDRGYLKISNWINNLCWHYIQKRKQLDKEMSLEFKELLEVQKEKINTLKPSLYKDGLQKAIDDIST